MYQSTFPDYIKFSNNAHCFLGSILCGKNNSTTSTSLLLNSCSNPRSRILLEEFGYWKSTMYTSCTPKGVLTTWLATVTQGPQLSYIIRCMLFTQNTCSHALWLFSHALLQASIVLHGCETLHCFLVYSDKKIKIKKIKAIFRCRYVLTRKSTPGPMNQALHSCNSPVCALL